MVSFPAARPVRYTDIPPQLQTYLDREGVSAAGFDAFIRSVEQKTAERLREGENDHLIYFLLQSRRFTSWPRIEPALSAREFTQTGKVPAGVARRVRDFVQALERPGPDQRLAYFKGLVPSAGREQYLGSEYARSMQFLYRKEFESANVAALYQQRGHSTDTQVEANFAVWTALSVLRALPPAASLNRVLIVGPGLDFAPRTELLDELPPQSYQPFAVADGLLDLGLAERDRLRIHCVDINDRVVRYLRDFSQRPELTLLSGITDAEYRSYFERLGRNIGHPTPAEPAGSYLKKSVTVERDIAAKITAEKLNILTQRYEPSPGYDLVVATNVLLYFNPAELLLVLANIQSMLRPGGSFIHNDLRPQVEEFARALGLPPVQGRTLQVGQGRKRPLVDSFVIHRKR